MNLKNIGLQIKHLRLSSGLTQKQLADKIGVSWEMISRYETGRSSPLNQLLPIAEALETSPAQVIRDISVQDHSEQYQRNTIPLLDKPFKDLATALRSTKNFYVAPDWIVQQSSKPFAIDSSIIIFETSKISGNGILYASSYKPDTPSNLALILEDENLIVTSLGNRTSRQKVIGTIIAMEERLV